MAPLTSPLDGGRAWRELRSEHFTLQTDAIPARAEVILERLELVHHALQAAAFPYTTRLPGRASVMFVDGLEDLTDLGYPNEAGVAIRRTLHFDEAGLFLIADRSYESTLATLQHELTHRFVHFYYPSAPVWLNEGLAEYYSTLEIHGTEVRLGRPLHDVAFTSQETWGSYHGRVLVPIKAVPDVDTLRAMTSDRFYRSSDANNREATAHYAGAWALVQTLSRLEPSPQRFYAYLDELHRGRMSESRAWQRSFGHDQVTIQRWFQASLTANEGLILTVTVPPPPPLRLVQRAMTASEVHTLWALARRPDTVVGARAVRADLDRAIAADPRFAEAYLRRAQLLERQGRLRDAEADLRRAISTSDDARYVLGLAAFRLRHGSPRDDEMEAWVLRISRAPRSAAELDFLASWALAMERPAEAHQYALRAVNADASCFYCYATLGRTSAAQGDWPGAVASMRTALNLLPHARSEPSYPKLLMQYARELEKATPR